ncbi:MAG TPA: terminase, partial [Streptomyces sp.]
YIGILDGLTGVRKQRLRHGLWVAAEGLVYEEYSPKLHLIDHFEPPASWARWWSVDFGFTNPMVVQFWAEDPDGRLYLYRELYRTKRLVEDFALDVLLAVTRPVKGARLPLRSVLTAKDVRADVRNGLREWTEPKPRAIVCDHDAEDRETLARHLGIPNVPADKRKTPGIQAVQGRFKVADDGKPRIFFMRDALVERDPELQRRKLPCCTVEELPGYVWEDKAKKEEPVKENDHGMDPMRYIVAQRDLGSQPNIRSFGGGRRR